MTKITRPFRFHLAWWEVLTVERALRDYILRLDELISLGRMNNLIDTTYIQEHRDAVAEFCDRWYETSIARQDRVLAEQEREQRQYEEEQP